MRRPFHFGIFTTYCFGGYICSKEVFMKKFLLPLFCFLFYSISVFSQVPKDAKLTSIRQVNSTIEFAVKSSETFYAGNNTFVLKVGNASFSLYRQETEDGDASGRLVFLIPESDYVRFMDADKIYLTYGQLSEDGEEDDLIDVCRQVPARCIFLGMFAKSLLTK